MTDPKNDQAATLAHPLPDGVSDTFVRPCLDCGTTVHVVGGQEQEHHCATPRDTRELIAQAWWAGHDAARAGRSTQLETLLGADGHGYLPSGVALDLVAIADDLDDDHLAALADAMGGVEVSVGFRDDAGDDDWVTGTIDRDDRVTLARSATTFTHRPLLAKWIRAMVSAAKASR